MFFAKTTTSSDGIPVAHHQLVRAEMRGDMTTVGLWLDSWPDEAARLAGGPAVARFYVQAAAAGLSFASGLAGALSGALLASAAFTGATELSDASLGLPAAKQRKTAEIAAARAADEFGGFVWSGSTFASDAASQTRIFGAMACAIVAQRDATSMSIDWPLMDGSYRALDEDDLVALGQALLAHDADMMAAEQTARAAIALAANDVALGNVVWAP